jgi:hypothetical protein
MNAFGAAGVLLVHLLGARRELTHRTLPEYESPSRCGAVRPCEAPGGRWTDRRGSGQRDVCRSCFRD